MFTLPISQLLHTHLHSWLICPTLTHTPPIPYSLLRPQLVWRDYPKCGGGKELVLPPQFSPASVDPLLPPHLPAPPPPWQAQASPEAGDHMSSSLPIPPEISNTQRNMWKSHEIFRRYHTISSSSLALFQFSLPHAQITLRTPSASITSLHNNTVHGTPSKPSLPPIIPSSYVWQWSVWQVQSVEWWWVLPEPPPLPPHPHIRPAMPAAHASQSFTSGRLHVLAYSIHLLQSEMRWMN